MFLADDLSPKVMLRYLGLEGFLNLIYKVILGGWFFPLSRIHIALCRWGYLKCLVNLGDSFSTKSSYFSTEIPVMVGFWGRKSTPYQIGGSQGRLIPTINLYLIPKDYHTFASSLIPSKWVVFVDAWCIKHPFVQRKIHQTQQGNNHWPQANLSGKLPGGHNIMCIHTVYMHICIYLHHANPSTQPKTRQVLEHISLIGLWKNPPEKLAVGSSWEKKEGIWRDVYGWKHEGNQWKDA